MFSGNGVILVTPFLFEKKSAGSQFVEGQIGEVYKKCISEE